MKTLALLLVVLILATIPAAELSAVVTAAAAR